MRVSSLGSVLLRKGQQIDILGKFRPQNEENRPRQHKIHPPSRASASLSRSSPGWPSFRGFCLILGCCPDATMFVYCIDFSWGAGGAKLLQYGFGPLRSRAWLWSTCSSKDTGDSGGCRDCRQTLLRLTLRGPLTNLLPRTGQPPPGRSSAANCADCCAGAPDGRGP